MIGNYSRSSHKKQMKTIENQGFLTTSSAMGRSVSVRSPSSFKIVNKINSFERVSYGTALEIIDRKLFRKLLSERCRCRENFFCAGFICGHFLPVGAGVNHVFRLFRRFDEGRGHGSSQAGVRPGDSAEKQPRGGRGGAHATGVLPVKPAEKSLRRSDRLSR